MKFYRLGSNKLVNCNITKYLIQWDRKCRSKFQKEVKDFFALHCKTDLWAEEMPVFGSRMTIDMVDLSKKFAVEVQGAFHESYNSWAHKGNKLNYLGQIKRDESKRLWCEKNDLLLVEIYPKDLPLTKQFFIDNYDLYL